MLGRLSIVDALAHIGLGLFVADLRANIAHTAYQRRTHVKGCPFARQGIADPTIDSLQRGSCCHRMQFQRAGHFPAMRSGVASHCSRADDALTGAQVQHCLNGQTLTVDIRQPRHIQAGQRPVQTALLRVLTRQPVQPPRPPTCPAQACHIILTGKLKHFLSRRLRQHGKSSTY